MADAVMDRAMQSNAQAAPQSAPAQEQAPAQGGGAAQVIMQPMQVMATVGEAMQKGGAPEEGQKLLANAAQAYQEFLSWVSTQGQEGQPSRQPAGGNVPMEAGAARVQPAM